MDLGRGNVPNNGIKSHINEVFLGVLAHEMFYDVLVSMATSALYYLTLLGLSMLI